MLILHRDYHFTTKDIGKKALLANSQVVKILTVVREAGQLHSIYGILPGFTDVIEWDARGKASTDGFNIIMLFEE